MRKTFLISLLILVSCSSQHEESINSKYLACYALDQTAKKECLENFQFEAEKLGFKEFINKHGLACESVENGPVYVEDKQAYLVICKPKGRYFTRFNYDNKRWGLME